jgi:hypothetical protein
MGLEKKYPILFEKGIMGAANIGIITPIVVFLMDRIMITDNEVTPEETDMFKQLSNQYGDLFGFGSGNFMIELMRIGNIYGDYISFSEDARMTWEAVEFVASEFDEKQKKAMVEILERLATSDEYLDNKEMSILYATVMACYEEIDAINTVFSRFYEIIIKIHSADHQMAKALIHLMNLIADDPKSVKISVLGRPDPRTEGNIPPVLFTYEEFADWISLVSLIRASQQRKAKMNHTRVYWSVGIGQMQKGLIKFFNLDSSDDDQIQEALDFSRGWCDAVKNGTGNVPFPDEQIFQTFLFGDDDDEFGDCMQPNLTKSGIWKITCKKISSGIELHAFDITGDSKTYWCPETAKELAENFPLDRDWLNGNFPIEQSERDEIITSIRERFSE